MRTTRLLLISASTLGVVACGTDLEPSRSVWRPSPSLQRAHDALLDRHYQGVTKAAEEALRFETLDAPSADHLWQLLDVAYEETEGRLPSDWRPPTEISGITVEQLLDHRLGASSEYELRLAVRTKGAADLAQAELLSARGLALLDSKRDRYEVEEEVDGYLHWVVAPRQARPIRPGAYRLRLSLATGEVTEGWVVLQDLRSSETPRVEAIGDQADQRPLLHFELPSLPERADFEKVSLVVYAGTWRPDRSPEWKTEWLMVSEDLSLTEVQLGDARLGRGVESFPRGRHHAGVTLRMDRRWGPVTVRRLVRSGQAFAVGE